MKLYLVYRCEWIVNEYKNEIKSIAEIVGIFRQKENAEKFKEDSKFYSCEIDEVETDFI